MDKVAEYNLNLAEQINQGGRNAEEAMHELYGNLRIPSFVFIRKHLSGIIEQEPGSEEDIYHEAILGLYKKIKKDCVFEKNDIAGYMTGILKKICADTIKNKKRKRIQFDELKNLIHENKSDYNIESIITINDCIKIWKKKMSKNWKIFILHFVEGYKFSEIAIQLNISKSDAKVSSHRFIQKVRECAQK